MASQIDRWHAEAMDFAEQAMIAKARKEQSLFQSLTEKAFALESKAALQLRTEMELEPTRSVLFRSAASLALDLNRFREAEKLLHWGLIGDPPGEIEEELNDLLEQATFLRHLKLRNIVLGPNELQMSLSGSEIGLGIANTKEFLERAESIEKLVRRTTERALGLPYQERGPARKEITEETGLYMSMPRAASFAITFRLGSKAQTVLPGTTMAEAVIDEVFDCFEIYEKKNMEALKQRFSGDEAYYTNFVGLAKSILPDGENVHQVGFTSLREGQERYLAIRSKRHENTLTGEASAAHGVKAIDITEPDIVETTEVSIQGVLELADAKKMDAGFIELKDEDNKIHRIRVKRGLMADIVRPYFEYQVKVHGIRKGQIIDLIDIEEISDV